MRLIQQFLDRVVFVLVKLWVMAHAYRHWKDLRKRLKKKGVKQVRVVVPLRGDEKFFWRKVFDHDPRFVTLSDKIACKDWVAAEGIAVQTPKTLWVGTDANDIPDALWHQPSYLKASHGYNMNIAVLSPPADRAAVIAQANAFVDKEHGRKANQWAYRHVERRLLLEEALFVDQPMIEIKYYTNGPIVEQFVISRHGPPTSGARWVRNIDGGYELDPTPTMHGPNIDTNPLPPAVETGLALAKEIGSRFDQIRVDTMTDGETLYLGEITVYSIAGRIHHYGHLVSTPLNRSWDLRRSWFLTVKQPWPWCLYAHALRRALDRREARLFAK
ncbi:ATP-grasp fold amidoligase family protein [Yoonia sp. GPGPB17]|uniref:ATP-grasp fold amidoligase family protein n=1 Tax=Yoonia sp. GPGPB17 TaxID=3026147 RepID=UPI0030C00F09